MKTLLSVRTYRGGAAQRWQRLSGKGRGAGGSLTAPLQAPRPSRRNCPRLDLEPERKGDDVSGGAVIELVRRVRVGAGRAEELDELVGGLDPESAPAVGTTDADVDAVGVRDVRQQGVGRARGLVVEDPSAELDVLVERVLGADPVVPAVGPLLRLVDVQRGVLELDVDRLELLPGEVVEVDVDDQLGDGMDRDPEADVVG